MRKLVIFCESYMVYTHVLHMAIQNYRDRPITVVIPGFPNLFRFFQIINDKVFHNAINLIYVEPYQPQRAKVSGINKILYILPDIIRERRYLKDAFAQNFADCEGCEVFFFSPGFSGLNFYLLKKLSKRNRLVYVSLASLGPPWSKYTPANIVHLGNLIIWRLTYGREIILGQLPYLKGFLYMPDWFIKKKVDRVIPPAEINEMMKGFDLSPFRVFDAGNYRVIYFDDDLVGAGFISDGDTFRRELTSIFNIVSKYFPEKEIALKYHPGHSGDETLAGFGETLPQFIPAELLYNDRVKMYLGIFSRSIANVERGLAVSLAELITFKSDESRDKLKEASRLMPVSKSKILFPETLAEFEQILVDLKGQKI